MVTEAVKQIKESLDLASWQTADVTAWGGCFADNPLPTGGKFCGGLVRFINGRGTCPACKIAQRIVEPRKDEVEV